MRTLYFCPVVSFYLLSFFIPRLISAAADWMSTILPHMWCGLSANIECRSEMCCSRLAGNIGRKNDAKNRHLRTIAQYCRAISSQLRHILTIGKKLVMQQYLPHMSLQYGELPPTSGWDRFVSLGHLNKFQRVSRLGSVTAQPDCGVEQSIRQGGHHVGHWPTFLGSLYCADIWRTYCCLTSFFSDCRCVP